MAIKLSAQAKNCLLQNQRGQITRQELWICGYVKQIKKM